MSTQMTLHEAGSKLPTAMEWSSVQTQQRHADLRDVTAHRALRLDHIDDHVGQRAVVANRAGQDDRDVAPVSFVHDAAA